MKTQKKDKWEYTNEYGEKWIFGYDSLTGIGNLKGSDINWQSYNIIDGKAYGLLLNNGELKWLKEIWEKAKGKKSD